MPHIVITGGGRRLGLSLVRFYLKQGWHVSVLTRQSSVELKGIEHSALDIYELGRYSADHVDAAVKALRHQTVDVLVHNASFFELDCEGLEDSIVQLKTMMEVHVEMPVALTHALIDSLNRSDFANIIQMTDIYAVSPHSTYSNFCASKAAIANMSLSWAKRFAPKIRVNSIAPGALKFLPEHSAYDKQQVLSDSLLPFEGGFNPIIQTIEFLLTNSFITGTTMTVDGGRSLCR